jgi:hypothetical protein
MLLIIIYIFHVCTLHFVEFYYFCPTDAQHVLTISVSLQTFTQQALQIRIEPTRKTVPDSVDCIYSHKLRNNVLCTVIKQAF